MPFREDYLHKGYPEPTSHSGFTHIAHKVNVYSCDSGNRLFKYVHSLGSTQRCTGFSSKQKQQSADLGDTQTSTTHLFVCYCALKNSTMGLVGEKDRLSMCVDLHTQTETRVHRETQSVNT